jgi:hypothetical protein
VEQALVAVNMANMLAFQMIQQPAPKADGMLWHKANIVL